MAGSFFIVADASWVLAGGRNPRRLSVDDLVPIGAFVGYLANGCRLLVKFRDVSGRMATDDAAVLVMRDQSGYVQSPRLAEWVRNGAPSDQFLLFFFDGTRDQARCIVRPAERSEIDRLGDPERLAMFGLPPNPTTVIDSDQLVSDLQRYALEDDDELFSTHADRFLSSPNIITALFAHLQSIRAEDNIRFPVQLKTLADQLRTLLVNRSEEPRIRSVEKSHLSMWAEAQGQQFAFLDGGAARIAALPGMTPVALRVGVYAVRPGVLTEEREVFRMRPFIVGDLLDRERRPDERPDPKRLQEAARYTLEPLAGLLHLREFSETRGLFLHGPLVNQFTQYDEGPSAFIPFLDPAFLESVGIDREKVSRTIRGIPVDTHNRPMWNHFMAVYAYVMREIQVSATPILGVVERPVGRSVTISLLHCLEQAHVFTAAYRKRVSSLLDEYDITDDFLFGCVLREGEYLTPVSVNKNPLNRPRERWLPVVRQLPQPKTILLKSEETNFPFRVEMNEAAAAQHEFIARFLYHTARLLPRYAFPAGLDIADKYAKIPDWLSRGVSAELAATVLRKAIETGDSRLVAAIRIFLAHSPRDFFYRPKV